MNMSELETETMQKSNMYHGDRLFILESLSIEDEKEKGLRLEGRIIYDMLEVAGKNPRYFYFRTKQELIKGIKEFENSRYRHLHFSSHGNHKYVCLSLNNLKYSTFSKLFNKTLNGKRLYMSACEVGNQNFMKAIIKENSGIYSIIAPSKPIDFDKALAFWIAFYTKCEFTGEDENEQKSKPRNNRSMKAALVVLAKFFETPFSLCCYNYNKNNEASPWEFHTIPEIGKQKSERLQSE